MNARRRRIGPDTPESRLKQRRVSRQPQSAPVGLTTFYDTDNYESEKTIKDYHR